MKTVAFDRRPKSSHTYSSLRDATPFSKSAKTSATGRRAPPAESHVLSKTSQISLCATDTNLCARKGDARPGARYRERPGLVVSLVGKDTPTTNKTKTPLRYCPVTASDLRLVPPPGRNPNTARESKRDPHQTPSAQAQERPRGKTRNGTVTETIEDSRNLQSAAAYHDLQHAAGRLDDLISDTSPSKSKPLRSGLCTSCNLPARTCATRRVAPNASARSPGRSTSMYSTLRTLVRSTARSEPLGKCLSRLAARPEHVLVQTALPPTLSQWVPALVLIHPHVTLGPCTPLGVQSLQLSTWTATAKPSRHAPSP